MRDGDLLLHKQVKYISTLLRTGKTTQHCIVIELFLL